MKKQLFLAFMTVTSLGSLQAANDLAAFKKLGIVAFAASGAAVILPPVALLFSVGSGPLVSFGVLHSIYERELPERFRQYPALMSLVVSSNILYYYGFSKPDRLSIGLIAGFICGLSAIVADSMPRGALRPPFHPNNNDADEGLGEEI